MSVRTSEHSSSEVPSAAVCAEAAAWIARLHGTERTTVVEEGFRSWLAASPMHRQAFEMANDIWTGTERWPKPSTPAFVRWPRAGLILTLPRAVAAVALIAVLALGTILALRDTGLATDVGEQRSITLADGTRISLNTATRIHVEYDETARRVRLDTGEALFEVARNAERPFIVTAGEREITALGTAFVVRHDAQEDVAVTLIEGRVSVSAPPASVNIEPVILEPGQRLTFRSAGEQKMDRPAMSQVTAWQRGQVMLDHTPLWAAIEEMNRYSVVQLTIDDPGVAALEVTGVFRSGDSVSFAEAVAQAHDLEVVHEPRMIRIVQP